ncbi:SRPBCC family protein [Amantichitinum ursilacus]|uniref:Polyketide cyclase / dehydrase and lipid transport n=1 Tax=Amantichitinum ursilacus TaxID=857265 RepID=A0A0N0GLW4_9NEIS|nr:SRPBCC family protein [Amantichitinum ursilacus]KPC50301.1 Polyketide cyclase / dehydrase and lipid transport [Amantichitinum ursilacus]
MKLLSSALCMLMLCAPVAFAADAGASQPEAHVTKNGDTVELDTQFSVPVSREIAWGVLTDFEHMTAFIPNLASSKILEKNGNVWKVEQTGKVAAGLFHVNYDSVRELTLTPQSEIKAHTVGGDSGAMESVSTLSEKNGETVVSYRAQWTPSSSLVGSLGAGSAKSQLQRQFAAMEHEMLKRAGKATASEPASR